MEAIDPTRGTMGMSQPDVMSPEYRAASERVKLAKAELEAALAEVNRIGLKELGNTPTREDHVRRVQEIDRILKESRALGGNQQGRRGR